MIDDNEYAGRNMLKYLVWVSAAVVLSFCIALCTGCASRRSGDMGDQMGLVIAEKMKKDQL